MALLYNRWGEIARGMAKFCGEKRREYKNTATGAVFSRDWGHKQFPRPLPRDQFKHSVPSYVPGMISAKSKKSRRMVSIFSDSMEKYIYECFSSP